MNKIILASNSPRRKEILEQVGITFDVCPSTSDENTAKSDPIELVEEISSMKAMEVANRFETESVIVIGADTVVVHEGEVLGKPQNEQHAKKMLRALQNGSHEVFTGVTIILKNVYVNNEKIEYKKISFADVSKVIVLPMTNSQIDAYVASNEPMDKAGAYAIQGRFAIYIKEIIGDYYNIVGLPISKIYDVLLSEGINILQ